MATGQGPRLSYWLQVILLVGVVVGTGLVMYRFLLGTPVPRFGGLIDVIVSLLFGFLLLLVARYFAILWFAYVDQVSRSHEGEREGLLLPVSILVPAFNEGAVIQASLRSLIELDYPRYEIIVIDDGSTDETAARAKELAGDYGAATVRVISKANGGKASALNVGIAAARYPIVLCMDGDSKLTPGTLRAAVRHFADPAVGAVAGNVKVINRTTLVAKLQALEYVEGLNLVRRPQGFFRAVSIIPGPVGVFRRETLLAVGGYDGDTFAEDCDLTFKILRQGWKIYYEPEAVAFTEAPEHLLDLIKQRYRWTRGILQALRKHRGMLLPRRGHRLEAALGWYMVFEAVIWPGMNVLANVFCIYLLVAFGSSTLLVLWWAQLTLLDVVAALFCATSEEEELLLVPYAIAYRIGFALFIDVCKLGAMLEEYLRIEMNWGKVERHGRL